MQAIMLIEFKGFSQIPDVLSKDMSHIGVTSDRTRSSIIYLINNLIDGLSLNIRPLNNKLIGDTWCLTFKSIEEGVLFGCNLLRSIFKLVHEKALFYLKPTIALNYGNPKFHKTSFLDSDSIAAYRIADSGKPFNFYIVDKAIPLAQRRSDFIMRHLANDIKLPIDKEVLILDWLNYSPNDANIIISEFFIPTLLLDSEIIYTRNKLEAIQAIRQQQNSSRSIAAFGGPVPLEDTDYSNYIGDVLQSLKNDRNQNWTLCSYLPLNEPIDSFSWLEFCRKLSLKYPSRFSFTAFSIPAGQLRPISYHIYDNHTIHIALRSYSPSTGLQVLGSSIIFGSQEVARRFESEFTSTLTRVGPLDNTKYIQLFRKFSSQLKQKDLSEVNETIDLLLNKTSQFDRVIPQERI